MLNKRKGQLAVGRGRWGDLKLCRWQEWGEQLLFSNCGGWRRREQVRRMKDVTCMTIICEVDEVSM